MDGWQVDQPARCDVSFGFLRVWSSGKMGSKLVDAKLHRLHSSQDRNLEVCSCKQRMYLAPGTMLWPAYKMYVERLACLHSACC